MDATHRMDVTERPGAIHHGAASGRRGARARWRVVTVIAPAAAAIFAGTTAWAIGHDPHATAPKTPQVTPEDPQVTALRAAVAADQKKLADLQRKLNNLNATAAALTGGGSGSQSQSTQSTSSSTAQNPAPAPAAHAATGASGAVK